jgi:DNA polymerase II small subunit/DNA polymerase delta subunit B
VEGDVVRLIQKLTRRIAELESRDWYKEAVKYKQKLKVERRKQRTWQHCFISDLHCGSIYFDVLAFKTMLKRLEEEKLRCENLHVAGDVVEGKFNRRGQDYEAFPADVQQMIAAKSLKRLIETLRPRKLYVIPGNHDRKYSINLLDRVIDELKKTVQNLEIQYFRDDEYYVVENILVLHGITRSSGSDYTGLAPLIQSNLIPLALQHNADVIVLGHHHRSVIIRYMGRLIIALPSFQYASKLLRNERGMIMMRGDELKIVSVEPSDRATLINYWRTAIRA